MIETQLDELSAAVGRSYSLAFAAKKEQQTLNARNGLAAVLAAKELTRRVESEMQTLNSMRTDPISLGEVSFQPSAERRDTPTSIGAVTLRTGRHHHPGHFVSNLQQIYFSF